MDRMKQPGSELYNCEASKIGNFYVSGKKKEKRLGKADDTPL